MGAQQVGSRRHEIARRIALTAQYTLAGWSLAEIAQVLRMTPRQISRYRALAGVRKPQP